MCKISKLASQGNQKVDSQTPHIRKVMLVQDCGEVALGHVVFEGAVEEDNGRFASRGKFLVPSCDAEGQWFRVDARDRSIQADQQNAGTDALHDFPANRLRFDGYAEIEAELEQQFRENIPFGAVGLNVDDPAFEGSFEIAFVRLPSADVAAVFLKDPEAVIAGIKGMLRTDLLPSPAEAFLRQFGDVILSIRRNDTN